MAGFPLMAIGAGLGIAADQINKQRQQQAALQIQQQRYAREMAMLQMALQDRQQKQNLAALDLTPPDLSGAGGAAASGMAAAPGENNSPYVGSAGGGAPSGAGGSSFGTGLRDLSYPQGLSAITSLGVNPDVARGAVDYMLGPEAGRSPTVTNPLSGAFGRAQWLGPRKAALIAKYGPNPTDEQEAEFIKSELLGPESGTLDALRAAKTPREGFMAWGQKYERPSPAEFAKAMQMAPPYAAMPQQTSAPTPDEIRSDAGGSYRIPDTFGSEAADKAIFGGQQVAQAASGPPPATDATPPPPRVQIPYPNAHPLTVGELGQLRQEALQRAGGDQRAAGVLYAAWVKQLNETRKEQMDQNRFALSQATAERQAVAAEGQAQARGRVQEYLPDGTPVAGIPGKPESWTTLAGKKLTPDQLESLDRPGTSKRAPQAAGALPPGWDNAKLDFWANVLRNGGHLPPGLTRVAGGSLIVQELMKRVPGMAGSDAGNFIANTATVKADDRSLSNMTRMRDAAVSFERTASRNFDLALKLSKDAVPTDLGPFFNRWIMEGEKMFGDTSVPPYITAMLTGANEYAKIMSGSTGAQGSTVDSRREAAELFSPYLSTGQIDRVVAVAKADMANRKGSLDDQLDDIKGRLRQAGSPKSTGAQEPSREGDVPAPQGEPGGGGAQHPPVSPPLQGKTLQWSPSKQQFRDEQGNLYDQGGNPVAGNAGPQL